MTDGLNEYEPEGAPPRDNPFEREILIGMVVERFALLESTLRRTAWLLLFGDPVAAHVLTVQESAQRLIDLCGSILKESRRKGVERGTPELSAGLEAAKLALGRRNDLLHNLQLPGDDFKMETWKYRRGQDQPVVIPAGVHEMRALWFDVNEVITQLVSQRPNPPFEMPSPYT